MTTKYVVVVVGSGGTGSYFLKEVSRFLSKNKLGDKVLHRYIVDGDRVEAKNLVRQSFLPEDIGKGKACVMAEILGDAFEVRWKAVPNFILKKIDLEQLVYSNYDGEIPIIIGCCDNHACRKVMEDFFFSQKTCIYLDAANEFRDGSVVYALRHNGKTYGGPRSTYFPSVFDGDMRSVEELSCEELNNAAPQHIATNMMAGNLLLAAFCDLLGNDRVNCGVSLFGTGISISDEKVTPAPYIQFIEPNRGDDYE